jgi:Ala-tRNA(Pro) deacylase
MDQYLLQFLSTHNISYIPHKHEAVFTVDSADRVFPNIAGMHVKNLFLKDRYGKYYLVCVEAHKRLPIKDFGRKF